MSEQNLKTICFDYSHNNTLVIESPSYADFTHYLFGSSFRLGKIQAGFLNIDKLKSYRMVVIGGPINSEINQEEIDVLVQFVKEGGSLLLISGEGGDYRAGSNLSELTEHFGFKFNNDVIMDSMNYIKIQSRLKIDDFEPHIISKNINNVILSKPCSIQPNNLVEADEDVNLVPLIKTGLNSYKEYYDGEKWVENADAPRSILALYVKFHLGKVIALPSLSLFSSLSSSYGYYAFDNHHFISNIFQFLLESDEFGGDEKLINVQLNYNIFSWAEKLVQDQSWSSIDDIINFSMKYLKDYYKDIMKNLDSKRKELIELRKKQLASIKDKKERQRQAEVMKNEMKIYDAVDRSDDSGKDLQAIMQSLSAVTGGEVGNDFDLDAFSLDDETEKGTDSPYTELIAASEEKSSDAIIDNDEEDVADESMKDIADGLDKFSESGKINLEDEDEEENDLSISDTGDDIGERISENVSIQKKIDEVDVSEEKDIDESTEDEISPEKTTIDIKESIKEEFTRKFEEKLNSKQKETSKIVSKEKTRKKSEADSEIDDALAKLGSFDDFKKKLAEFQDLTDEDAPVSLANGKKEKKDQDEITDDDIFA